MHFEYQACVFFVWMDRASYKVRGFYSLLQLDNDELSGNTQWRVWANNDAGQYTSLAGCGAVLGDQGWRVAFIDDRFAEGR